MSSVSSAVSGFLSSRRLGRLLAVCLLACCAYLPAAWAQPTETYRLYLDRDQNPATGCTATLRDRAGTQVVRGAEMLLSVDVGTAVGPLMLAECQNGQFGAAQQVAAGHALAQTVSAQQVVDHVELGVPLAALGATGRVALAVA